MAMITYPAWTKLVPDSDLLGVPSFDLLFGFIKRGFGPARRFPAYDLCIISLIGI
jgi:hypothetical protein